MKKRILIVGGTSGLGLELARIYSQDGHTVCVTGRSAPELANIQFEALSITSDNATLQTDLDQLVSSFDRVNTLVYAAGFLQRGTIDTLSDAALQQMTNVGLLAPMLLVQRLKNRLDTPLKVMLITSSSQYTPRELEPAYCAVKAGLGMLGASLVRDSKIGKVLVAAPSGINTNFWSGETESAMTNDADKMLSAAWVAEQVVELSSGSFKYKYAKILRNPPRTEIQEVLDNQLNTLL